MSDYKTNLQILKNIRQIPDNRGLLARILCQRTYTEEEIKSSMHTAGVKNPNLEDFLITEDINGSEFQWRPLRYTFEDTEPPKASRKYTILGFHLKKSRKGKYKVKSSYAYIKGKERTSFEISPFNHWWGEYETKVFPRPKNQNLVKTTNLNEASGLISQGFELKNEHTETIEMEWTDHYGAGGSGVHIYKKTTYTLERKPKNASKPTA
jgi:hypothetical protein